MRLVVAATLLIFVNSICMAEVKFPAQARLFAGATKSDPVSVNAEMNSDGLKKVDSVAQYGVEITYPILKILNIGLRYTKRYEHQDELNGSLSTDYYGEINQDSIEGVARLSLIKTSFLHIDGFAGAGGSNTTFKTKTASGEGEVSRSASQGWFSSPIYSYGASVGIGWKNVFFTVEGGMESNKVTGLKSSGNIGTVDAINLSGSYFTVGLMFDGITATQK